MGSKVFEAPTLQTAALERAQQYETLKEQFLNLKKEFGTIVSNHDFQGKGADAIKGFYQGQIDVVDAWIRFIETNIGFLKGVPADTEDADLAGDTVVHVPFLDENIERAGRMAKDMVAEQQEALARIFHSVDDLVSLSVFSKESFDDQMDKAEKKRSETVEKVNGLDQKLTQEYGYSRDLEQHIYGLFGQLMQATRQGETISPLYFNLAAYQNSDVYRSISNAEKMKDDYLTFKKNQEENREIQKKMEEMENRPWYEKTWDTVCTFTGEVTGYYDAQRAATGVDPVTGRKLSNAERVAAGAMAAAGFIPVVGWVGRAAKGGRAIYKTAKGISAADHMLDAYKTTKGLQTLHKAEYGIYGLVSANGFGEYFTGKDMFGNQLTEEQRNQSLFNAFAIIGVAGAGHALDKLNTKNFIKTKTILENDVRKNFIYNMIEKPGPLLDIDPGAAATFRSGMYNEIELPEDIVLYRAGKAGGGRNAFGQYFTREPVTRIECRIDLAVKTQWIDPKTGVLTGSSPIDSVYALKIPKGTKIYEGPAGYQSGIYSGGGNQIFVSKPWALRDIEVLSETPIK